MVKLIELIKRKEGITHEEFMRYWSEKHGPLIARTIPGLKRYIQNHPIVLSQGKDPPLDGIAELWFDDLKAWRRSAEWFLGDEGKEAREDAEKFVDRRKLVVLVCEEKVFKE